MDASTALGFALPIGLGLAAIPDAEKAKAESGDLLYRALPEEKLEKERRIILAYAAFQCPADC